MQIPQAPKHPQKISKHSDTRIDNYFWLREKKNPETLKYLNAENEFYKFQLKHLNKNISKLFKELKSRIPADDNSVPAPLGPYEYFSKNKKGQQYKIHYRRLIGSKVEQVVIDENQLAKGRKYFDLGNDVVSPDHQLLAYATDTDGSEKYTIYIRDIKTQKDHKLKLYPSAGSFVWSADSQSLYYVVLDKNLRPFQVYRHDLGTSTKTDKLIYEEKDGRYFVGLSMTSSKKYILLNTSGKEDKEVWFLDARKPYQKFRCFAKRQKDVSYNIDHRNQEFWIHTNQNAKNNQIFYCHENAIERKSWKPFLKNSKDIYRTWIRAFNDHLAIGERSKGLPQIRIYNFVDHLFHLIKFPDVVYSMGLGENYEFDTSILRLSYSSPIWPPSIIDYDMNKKIFSVRKEAHITKYNKKNYICKRVWVKSHDGVRVPLTLLYKKGLKKKAPCYLYGYGSYGHSISDSFGRNILSLVDRGFVYALAHVRGGSEMGRKWYDSGKFLKKKNTFKDFIACADYLVKNNWTMPSRLVIAGGSAGGMLMGACMNMRPDLFGLVVAHVPFVDVVNTMLDDTLLLTPIEYDEWGNPNDKKYYNYMKSYSPYDNVVAKDYPAMFVTCGLNDPRVTYWEPAKWVAKLRELKTNQTPILYKINMGAGHFGTTGRYEVLKETAEEYAYILSRLKYKS